MLFLFQTQGFAELIWFPGSQLWIKNVIISLENKHGCCHSVAVYFSLSLQQLYIQMTSFQQSVSLLFCLQKHFFKSTEPFTVTRTGLLCKGWYILWCVNLLGMSTGDDDGQCTAYNILHCWHWEHCCADGQAQDATDSLAGLYWNHTRGTWGKEAVQDDMPCLWIWRCKCFKCSEVHKPAKSIDVLMSKSSQAGRR